MLLHRVIHGNKAGNYIMASYNLTGSKQSWQIDRSAKQEIKKLKM